MVRAREVLGLVGVELYRVRVKDLAEALNTSPGGVSEWWRRAFRRRVEDERFAELCAALDVAASSVC